MDLGEKMKVLNSNMHNHSELFCDGQWHSFGFL